MAEPDAQPVVASIKQPEVPMHSRHFISMALILLLASATATASKLGDSLNRELKGAWAIVDAEVYSNCTGSYNDNTVGQVGVASKASHRFEAGEIVKIDSVKVKRQRVDLLLTLVLGIRVPWTDGPFELFDDRKCKVQLIFPVPREQVKGGDVATILEQIRGRVTLFGSATEARESEAWNGRELEELPDDYQRTLQLHAAWQAETTNAAVRAEIAEALEEAADIADDLDDDDEYLAGFAAGSEEMSSFSTSDCSTLLSVSFTTYRDNPPKDRSKAWRDGWEDGQKLVFNVLVADRLGKCTVPVPVVTDP